MKIGDTAIEGVKLLSPEVFADERGSFVTFIDPPSFERHDLTSSFSQHSASVSHRRVIRGLHFQWPQLQVKVVRAVRGEVFDVTVDLRPSSKTFGKVHLEVLRGGVPTALYIPAGIAHGFQALVDDCEISYAIEPSFVSDQQHTLCWNDDVLSIDWPLDHPVLSEKDQRGMSFRDAVDMMVQ